VHRSRQARELPIECTLLAATALTRTGRADEALEQLSRLESRKDYTPKLAIEAELLRSVSEFALGNAERSSNCVEKAAALLALVDGPEMQHQVRLYQAYHAWIKRDMARAEMLARAAMQSSDGAIYAPAAQIVGFAVAHRGKYLEQLSILEETLAHLDRTQHSDLWIEASILQNISGVIYDFHLPAVARRLAERAELMDWTDETAVALYHIFRSLAYSRSFGSDALSAFDYIERAENVIPSEGWELSSRLDRVFFADEFGSSLASFAFDAEAQIRRAEEIANAIEWTRMRGEERCGLLMLADVLSSRRPRDAERYLRLYHATKSAMSPSLMGKFDARWIAIEEFVEGLIAAADHNNARSVELISRAFEFWKSVGYAWRATRAALKLHEVTGERRYIDWADREARGYPFSWISEAVKRTHKRQRAR
jgi:hypothetical protein